MLIVSTRVTLFFLFFLSGIGSLHAAPLPAPPQLSASSYLLIDHDSGRVIAEKNADLRIEPASLTKMMTSYIVSAELERGSISIDDDVIISEFAQSMPGSRMFIESGKTVPLIDLLRGLIIQSGNDSSVALAEHIAASEPGFVSMMNQMAQALGMDSTNFMNASGLPHEEHYTTATDLAILSRALIRDYPEEYAMYSIKDYEFNGIKQNNRNKLLWRDDSVDGIKTGHTEAAGYCLVASAVREDMRLISVILGTASEKTRAAESQQLLNYGFRFFRTERIYAAGETVQEARIWMGREQTLPLGVADDLFVTLPRDAFEDLTSQIELSEYIRAPARIGQEFGRSVLKSGDRVVGEVPLLALRKIEEGGIFQRMKDSVMRHFQ
ncbi:MAG: D-alanyl-D-alanine carboxypeptidase [Gammaproteobacteria bacterium]|nr:D-alanyl-D-alanine carboxypeptidase [Gammaproteobacteria bacterium]